MTVQFQRVLMKYKKKYKPVIAHPWNAWKKTCANNTWRIEKGLKNIYQWSDVSSERAARPSG